MTTSQRSPGLLKAPQRVEQEECRYEYAQRTLPTTIRRTKIQVDSPGRTECPWRDTGTEAEAEAVTNGQKLW
jgi:hypothetical protein